MRRPILPLVFGPAALACLALAGCDYDSYDYEPQIKERAAAEMHCPPESLQITTVPDRHGIHTFVVDGCGCTATYVCGYRDYDSCEREPTLEPAGSTCH